MTSSKTEDLPTDFDDLYVTSVTTIENTATTSTIDKEGEIVDTKSTTQLAQVYKSVDVETRKKVRETSTSYNYSGEIVGTTAQNISNEVKSYKPGEGFTLNTNAHNEVKLTMNTDANAKALGVLNAAGSMTVPGGTGITYENPTTKETNEKLYNYYMYGIIVGHK